MIKSQIAKEEDKQTTFSFCGSGRCLCWLQSDIKWNQNGRYNHLCDFVLMMDFAQS